MHKDGSLLLQFEVLSLGLISLNVYRTIIVPVVLYGCETWAFTLREEHRLRMFENRGLVRRIFEPKKEEVTGGWRKLFHEELHNVY
jgi:hypothetical protein